MVELNNGEQARAAPFHRRRPWTCCCLIFFLLILIIAIIIVILAFTVFKPKKAEVSVDKVELLNFKASLGGGIPPTPSINITLAVDLSLHNPNKASFKYTNSTAMVYYHDDEVAVVSIPAGSIGSDATKTISTTFVMLADQLVTNSHLVNDILAGLLPFTSRTKISGRVKVVFIKRHVDITSQCSISISVANASVNNTDCQNKVHL